MKESVASGTAKGVAPGRRLMSASELVVVRAAPASPVVVARAWLLVALSLLAATAPRTARAEIQDFNIVLNATDEYIHYGDGFLRGPNASIDLTDLTFEATSEAGVFLTSSWSTGGGGGFARGSGSSRDDDGGGDDDFTRRILRKSLQQSRRRYYQQQQQQKQRQQRWRDEERHGERELDGRRLSGDGGKDVSGTTYVDIVSFLQPGYCAGSRLGCDWTELGVGGKADNPEGGDPLLRWCCTGDAVDLGLCEGGDDQLGRLIIGPKFKGHRNRIDVSKTGVVKKKLSTDFFLFNDTGRYVVVFANCDASGRQVTVTGKAVWKSSHGYLPGELYGFLFFYIGLLGVYALLLLWFYCLMRLNAASRIPIEKWILLTIGMGLAEMVLRVADYLDWNMDGAHSNVLMYSGILMGVVKDGFSRGLLVMVSLGWGVIRDSLGLDLPKIVVLGIIYIACAAVFELTIAFAEQDIQSLSYDAEVELFDLATIFNFVVAAVNVVFIMWILDALNATMTYLDNMNQTRKLSRYLRLRTILLFAVLFAVVWAVFSLVDTFDEDGIVREEHEWVVNAATELNYLAVLIGVAILWKPNPNAKEYAYVMELPGTGSDGETELELTDVVPSAMDDFDDDFNDDNGQPTNFRNGNHDDRFKIDDAEHS